ncbi:hypothetical protein SAMN05216462_2852 [Xylanibacter ruminicola]|uniref:Uncharacterized protein n=1 Tax=Xylanibacter ruminicola TaxID=839 RepID=A0A1H4DT54_XYLRU|nr:hypothetical protein SAMN05216462_2517 [Xylanibacter ruminicola]SEA84801.1 hypothetical protein SAMN05216462_2852 [Xylanibacter ruminicola]
MFPFLLRPSSFVLPPSSFLLRPSSFVLPPSSFLVTNTPSYLSSQSTVGRCVAPRRVVVAQWAPYACPWGVPAPRR